MGLYLQHLKLILYIIFYATHLNNFIYSLDYKPVPKNGITSRHFLSSTTAFPQ